MNDPLDKIKEHIDDEVYDVESGFPLNDNLNLDEIIEREYKKAIKSLRKFKIIEYIEEKYNINHEKPELVILEDLAPFIGSYLPIPNVIIFSKKSVETWVDERLKFLSNKKGIEEIINRRLKFLSYKEIKVSISDIRGIIYLYRSYNTILLYPFYVNDGDIIESIAEFIILLASFHEIWHSIDFSILDKLEKDPTIKDRYYLLTILKDRENLELRASAFEVVMYYLVNGFHKDEKGYIPVYSNIPICRTYIEKIDILEKNKNTKKYVPYDLGFCYGNIIVAKYRSSLEDNIYKVIDDILHLDEKRAIEVIKRYI
jgi:hypothetical protein